MRTNRGVITFAFVVAAALLLAIPVAAAPASQGYTDCPWGYPAYDLATHSYVSQCSSGYAAAVSSPAKPAGLAMPVPAMKTGQAYAECPWGYPAYDTTTHTYFSQCSNGYVAPR